MKLTIELVPETCWYSNVRSNVTKDRWDEIRKECYEHANNKCEICGDVGTNQGRFHKVECHEIWNYDDDNGIQKLTGFISLCPNCHEVKHIGRAQMFGKMDKCVKHFMQVNKVSKKKANLYIEEVINKWGERSQYDWELDISYMDNYGLNENDRFFNMLKTLNN